jgi:ubiquitin carboxyl-terminal hydrolase 4/11/15
LHEDLNKVLKKPLVEKDESKRDDLIKSNDCWIGFLRRNQSILVDLLYGQYKSTLYCPNEKCGNISTTFDPFLSLSLPLVAYTHPYFIESYFIFFDTNVLPIKLRIPFTTECTIMAFRNKVSLLLNIHPFSFIIGKLDNGSFENFLASSNLLGKGYGQERTMYLIQIDPSLFYSKENKFYNGVYEARDYTKLASEVKANDEIKEKIFSEDYEENEEGKTKESICYYSKNYSGNSPAAVASNFPTPESRDLLINVDENYGFDDNYLKVLMFLKSHDEYSNNTNIRKRIIFPRIIYINKNWTTVDVHLKVFEFFLPILDKYEKKNNSDYENNFEKATLMEKFEYFFKKYDTDHNNDNVEYQKQAGFPYRIRIKNINNFHFENCYYCNRQKCDDCFFPYNNQMTINEIVKKIPTNDGLEMDNTYLYLKECQKYNAVKNKDFSFEITFLPKLLQAVKELNEFEDLSFTSYKKLGEKRIKIDDCFKLFVKLETLKENNEWYCSQCKDHQKADKRMEIYKAPKVLVIHLKRFSSHQKIDTLVDFPIYNLDLNSYVKSKDHNEELNYDLFAISNHYGGLGGGHYIAFAKNHISNRWFKFDDSSVYEISEGDLITSSAYVLFYRRRSNNPEEIEKLYNKPFINYEDLVSNNNCVNVGNTVELNGEGNTTVEMVIDQISSIPQVSNERMEEEFKNNSS